MLTDKEKKELKNAFHNPLFNSDGKCRVKGQGRRGHGEKEAT